MPPTRERGTEKRHQWGLPETEVNEALSKAKEESIAYLAPCFGLKNGKNRWKLMRTFRQDGNYVRKTAEVVARREHNIRPATQNISLRYYGISKPPALRKALERRVTQRQNFNVRTSALQRLKMMKKRFYESVPKEAAKLLGHPASFTMARSIIDIKDDIFVTEVRNRPLLGGSYKVGETREIDQDKLEQNEERVNTVATDGLSDIVKRHPSNFIDEDLTLKSLTLTNSYRKKRSKQKVVKWKSPIGHSIQILLEQLKNKIDEGRTGNIMLFGRCDTGRCGVLYNAATKCNGVRAVAILIELSREEAIGHHHHVGIVRFMLNPEQFSTKPIEESDISRACSCSSIGCREICGHVAICNKLPELQKTVFGISSMNDNCETNSLSETRWASVVYGNRSVGTSAIWVCIRTGDWTIGMPNFIPVIESRTSRSSRIISRRLRCTSCRRSNANRGACDHELAVVSEIKAIEKMDDQQTNENSYHDEEFFSDNDETYEVYEAQNHNAETINPNSYVSILPRRVLPCAADKKAVGELFRAVVSHSQSNSKGPVYTAFDKTRKCGRCGYTIDYGDCNVIRRPAVLHTLINGSLYISVVDLICPSCGTDVKFDGRDCAMFAATKKIIYHRELLDYWLYQVSMVGGTFREAYELSKQVSRSTSAEYFRLGNPLSSNRRTASSAFSSFLSTIAMPPEDVLSKVFSCSKCEKVRNDGSKEMRAVVMDGTATGILGELPPYDRPSFLVAAATDTTKIQFLFPASKARSFFNEFFRAASSSCHEERFEMKTVDQRTSYQVRRILYPVSIAEDSAESSALLRIMEIAYNPIALQNIIIGYEKRRSGREAGVVIVEHSSLPSSLRRNLAEFLRTFTTGSLPVSVLKTSSAMDAADKMATAMDIFRQCEHIGRISELQVCECCTYSLATVASEVEIELPTTAMFVSSLCEARLSSRVANYREIAEIVSILLRSSITVRKAFSQRFYSKQTIAAQQYSNLFESPAEGFIKEYGIGENTDREKRDESGLLAVSASSAARTGELYPGRPLVRPRVRFNNGGCRDGWSDECTKSYRHGQNHSPGLFTLQCACVHPKLLGISVMMSSESVSTALTAVISRFKTLPEIAFYDNACNLARSVTLRFPWVNEKMKILCDRFHYRTHKCGPEFDPDSYADCSDLLTSGAESLNRQWSVSRSNIRFLSGQNLIPFLYARAIFINLRAHLRDERKAQDIEDQNVINIASKLMPCKCSRCKRMDSLG